MTDQPRYVDGNALAGPLADIFAVDVTGAATSCVRCGRRSALAELHVYRVGAGSIARCPGCQEPVIRYARTPRTAVIDLRGTVALTVQLPDGSG